VYTREHGSRKQALLWSARMSVRASFLALLLAACGSTATTTASTTPHSRARPAYTVCTDAAQVRLAPSVCWSPAGSHWHVEAQAPGGTYTFDLELMAAGRVRATDVTGASPATDEWFVENDELRIFLQNRYVEYRTTLHNGTLLIGEAVNVRGDVWPFRADRTHVSGSCPANELATNTGDEPSCFDVAGTRWTVNVGASTYELQFGAEGTLFTNEPTHVTPDDDGWEQQGATLRFWFDDHATELTATIAAGDLGHLAGNGHDAHGASVSFTAAAIPSYPPPIH
jgi:hypothetical protein